MKNRKKKTYLYHMNVVLLLFYVLHEQNLNICNTQGWKQGEL